MTLLARQASLRACARRSRCTSTACARSSAPTTGSPRASCCSSASSSSRSSAPKAWLLGFWGIGTYKRNDEIDIRYELRRPAAGRPRARDHSAGAVLTTSRAAPTGAAAAARPGSRASPASGSACRSGCPARRAPAARRTAAWRRRRRARAPRPGERRTRLELPRAAARGSRAAHAGESLDLGHVGDRHDPGDDRDLDPDRARLLDEPEVRSLSKNSWVIRNETPLSTFCLRNRRSLRHVDGLRMDLREAGGADAQPGSAKRSAPRARSSSAGRPDAASTRSRRAAGLPAAPARSRSRRRRCCRGSRTARRAWRRRSSGAPSPRSRAPA